jgi:FkbM family methyltransferase
MRRWLSYSWYVLKTLRGHEAFRSRPFRTTGRGFLWLLHVLARREARVKFPLFGVTMIVPPRLRMAGATNLYVSRDFYDPELRWAAGMLSEGMVVVDGGANIGVYATVAAKMVGVTGRVLAFEPGEQSFAYLARNAEMSEFHNLSVFRLALSDKVEERKLFHIDAAPNSYSLAERGSEFELVQTTTLDRIAEEEGLSRLDLIKLDVEGAEELVLRGARRVLEEFAPVVLFESYPERARDLGCRPEGVGELLGSYGYRLSVLGPDGGLVEVSEPKVGNNIALPPSVGSE